MPEWYPQLQENKLLSVTRKTVAWHDNLQAFRFAQVRFWGLLVWLEFHAINRGPNKWTPKSSWATTCNNAWHGPQESRGTQHMDPRDSALVFWFGNDIWIQPSHLVSEINRVRTNCMDDFMSEAYYVSTNNFVAHQLIWHYYDSLSLLLNLIRISKALGKKHIWN